MINKGTVFKDIDLNNLKVGQRYTITDVDGNIDRGTLSRIVPAAAAAPGVPEGPNQLIFDNVNEVGRMNIPANLVARIQQYNVGPNEDTGGLINQYIGGRRKKRTRKKRRKKKTKKRRRRKRKKTKRRRRRRKKRRKTRR